MTITNITLEQPHEETHQFITTLVCFTHIFIRSFVEATSQQRQQAV